MEFREPRLARRHAPAAVRPISAQGLTALLVDYEPLAREWLRRSLERDGDVEVVGECSDGIDAVAAIERHAPDLVFLEVELPGLDGFQVLEAAEAFPRRRPHFVFVTADDSHAPRAFAAGVLAYVLKPVDGELILGAVRRARPLQRARRAGW